MDSLAPIVLFVYNRKEHALRTLYSLFQNELAAASRLVIFSDGPKDNQEDISKVLQVRNAIREEKWCADVRIVESKRNKGLAESVISGVSRVINETGKVIVLEDDLLLSKGFLRYMNDALNIYEQEKHVMHISAYMFPVARKLPETFFLKGVTSTWGWATWKRAWLSFTPDAQYLAEKIERNNEIWKFNFNGRMDYFKMLNDYIKGRNDSWGVRWYASVFLAGGYALWPGVSLVENIGFDHSGVHSRPNAAYKSLSIADAVAVIKQKATDCSEGRKAMIKFYGKLNKSSFYLRNKTRIIKLLSGK